MTDQSDDEFDHDDLVERKVSILRWRDCFQRIVLQIFVITVIN